MVQSHIAFQIRISQLIAYNGMQEPDVPCAIAFVL